MNRRVRSSIVITVCLTSVVRTEAQQLVFSSLDRSNGLPSDYVMCMMQDREGYVWFGTDRGAARFDGYDVRTYTTRDGLAHNFITCLFQDRDGAVWLGTHEGGASRFNGKTFTTFDLKSGLPGNYVSHITQDRLGRIYIGTSEGLAILHRGDVTRFQDWKETAITRLHDGSLLFIRRGTIFRVIPSDDHSLSLSEITTPVAARQFLTPFGLHALEGDDGALWVGSFAGLVRLSFVNPDTLQFDGVRARQSILSMALANNGELWCGTRDEGVVVVNRNSAQVFSTRHGLKQLRIEAVLRDYEGGIWFSTFGSGVQRLIGTHLRLVDEKTGLAGNEVMAVFVDTRNRTWIGTAFGLSIVEGDTLRRITAGGAAMREVRTIAEDNRGTFYIGTFEYLFGPASYGQLRRASQLPAERIGYGVSSIQIQENVQDGGGSPILWVSTYGDGVHRFVGGSVRTFRMKDGLASDNIEGMVATRGGVWLLSKNSGASLLKGDSVKVFSQSTGLPSNTVYCVMDEEDGVVWFGTDVGAVRYMSGRYDVFGEASGLIGQNVLGIFSDRGRSRVWIVTDKALSQYVDGVIKPLGSSPIVPSPNSRISAVTYSPSTSSIWLATNTGAVHIALDRMRSDVPPPRITLCAAFTDTMMLSIGGSDLQLKYDQNNVSFRYAGLTFSNIGESRYRYRLMGLEEDWSKPTAERFVQYHNLSPGEYRFEVVAVNADGVRSNEPAAFRFVIHPPVWMRWWFLTIAGCVALSGIVGTVRYVSVRKLRLRVRKLEQDQMLQRERERISRDLHDHVGAQLANIISGLDFAERHGPPGSGRRARFLGSLREDARATIQQLRETIWALQNAEMSIDSFSKKVEDYTRRQVRFRRNITLQFRSKLLQGGVLTPIQALNLFRVCQEAVANALKHAKPRTLKITITNPVVNVLNISVKNDGFTPRPASRSAGGLGILNMRQRVEELGGTLDTRRTPKGEMEVAVTIRLGRS
jgi:ligand-binding sensor domain-containing protein/two-component sensor histidine kinase